MRLILLLILISFMDMPGCDLTGGPDHVQKLVETELRTYFPNGRVMVSPQQGTIFAVTCVHGLGKPFLEEMVKSLEKNRGVQRLHQARQLPVKLSPYGFVVLVFDRFVIQLDTDTKQHWIIPSDPQTSVQYESACSNGPYSPRLTGGNQAHHEMFSLGPF